MKYYKCVNANGASGATEGKIYEGKLSPSGNYLEFKNDLGSKDMLFLHRFKEVSGNDAIKLLEKKFEDIQLQADKEKQEVTGQIHDLKLATKIEAGSRWMSRDGEEYIIAIVDGGKYSAICLVDGLRWSDGVDNIENVFGAYHNFTKIQ